MKVQICTRRIQDGSWKAKVINMDDYMELVTGRRPADHEHYFRYDYGDTPDEAVENLLSQLAAVDGFSGEWVLV